MAAFDLDALAAERANTAEPFVFTFGGETYQFPPQMDLLAALDLAEGKVREAVQRLLGPEQYARMHASAAVLDAELFGDLLAAYSRHTGSSRGE